MMDLIRHLACLRTKPEASPQIIEILSSDTDHALFAAHCVRNRTAGLVYKNLTRLEIDGHVDPESLETLKSAYFDGRWTLVVASARRGLG